MRQPRVWMALGLAVLLAVAAIGLLLVAGEDGDEAVPTATGTSERVASPGTGSTSSTVSGVSTTPPPVVTQAPTATTPSPASTSSTVAGTPVTFHVYNAEVAWDCDPCDNTGLRVGFDSPDVDVRVRVDGWLHPESFDLFACPVGDLGVPSQTGRYATCVLLAPGGEVDVPHAGQVGVEIAVVPTATPPPGDWPSNLTIVDHVTVSYTATSSDTVVQVDQIRVPEGASVCKDNGCNPFFERTPFGAGTLRATATFSNEPPGVDGQLSLLAGGVVAHTFSETGNFYDVLGMTSGPSPLVAEGVAPSGEVAVALANRGVTAPLYDVEISITWP